MAATDRLTLLLEAKEIGLQDVLRMEQAINRVIAQGEKARAVGDGIATSARSQQATAESFGASIGQFIRDPLGSASIAAEGFVTKLGPMGLALGAAGVAATASGAALVSWIKSTGDAAEKILNLSITTGLSAKEVQLFQGALELSGASIEDLEKAAVRLNAQLSDTGTAGQKARQALAGIGVSIYDSNGALKEAGPLLLDLSRGLSAIGDRSERDRVGVDLLGKAYRALIPALTEIDSNVSNLRDLGFGIDEKTLQNADALADKLSIVEKKLGQLVFGAKSFIASLADPILDAVLSPLQPRVRGGAIGGEEQFRAPASQFTITTQGQSLIRGALSGGAGIESQRNQLSDLRTQIDSARLKLGQLADTPGLTNEAASREVAALRGLEAQYRKLEASIKASEDAKREFDKLNALGTFQVPDQFFAFGSRRTPSLRRGAEQQFPLGLGTFSTSEAEIAAANAGTAAATVAQNRALGAGIIAQQQQADQRRVESLQQALAFESERLSLLAGPGGELATVKAIAQLRLDAVERELAITGDLRAADEARLRIFRDRALEELRIAKERDDRNRQTGGQVFDALLAGGAGIRGFASGFGIGQGRTAFGNLFSEIARGTTGALQLPGQTGADGRPNLFGRVLSGTAFGLDPSKVSLDANTIATQQNTAALLGGRGASSIAGIPSTLFGGAGSNPLIFSASGRSSGITGPDGLPLGIVGQGLGLGNPNLGLTLGQKIGGAAAIAGGGFLVRSGIQQGGVGGALDIGSGIAGSLAALLPLLGVSGPAAPILAGTAIGAQLLKGFLPDPRKARARSIQQAIESSRFDFGDTQELVRDISGSSALDKGNTTIVYMRVDAMDSRGFIDHAREITDAVREGIKGGHPIVETLQGTLNPSGAY